MSFVSLVSQLPPKACWWKLQLCFALMLRYQCVSHSRLLLWTFSLLSAVTILDFWILTSLCYYVSLVRHLDTFTVTETNIHVF
jgi:hypothetical protein